MAMAIHLRPRSTILRNPNVVNLFSSSSSNTNLDEDPQSQPPQSPSPMSNYFSQVKASLKSPSSPPRRPPLSSSDSSQFHSLQEIRKNLSEYRDLTGSSPDARRLSSPRSNSPISFRELYEKNNVGGGNSGTAGTGTGAVRFSFDGIRESLKKFRPNQGGVGGDRTVKKDPFSLNDLRGVFRSKPDITSVTKSSVVSGGMVAPPPPDFDSVVSGGSVSSTPESSSSVKNELIRTYRYEELGEKLRRLRPANAKPGQNWFSLAELNERLIKLRELEERESDKNIRGVQFGDIRESIQKLKISGEEAEENKKKSALQLQNLNLLANLRGTQSYMLSPPKDDLVEKYFHPDNMSSADKLKLELKKTRDEFKMSESDCGSSRVQVAQLTVKIKHLSSALHKKDKHSRKGLQEMVVRRKKLLKYLRRTDWDSYCFCLSKLGLRDNPDYKN